MSYENTNIESGVRINSNQFNVNTKMAQLIHEQINTAYNHYYIIKAYEEGRARDISDEPKAPLINKESIPAIIIGSGPSLDKEIEYLKDWKGGIFCSTSQARTLIKYNVEPTHIVALDPFCAWEEIDGIDWSKTKTKLITHPGVWPSLIENWPNDILLYYENIGDPNSFYSTVQKVMYTVREDQGKGIRNPVFRFIIKTGFALFACTPPLQLFAANRLGYGTIFLCGCDFSYPDNKERFTEWSIKPDMLKKIREGELPSLYSEGKNTREESEYWEKKENLLGEIPPERMPIKTNNGIQSERIHIYYKKNFVSAWRLCGATIYTSDHGALNEVPYVDIKKVIKKKGLSFKPQPEYLIKEITDKYLAAIGCYVIEGDDKKKLFVESENPEKDIAQYVKNINQNYVCLNCKNMVNIKDEIDHENGECPVCHVIGSLRHNGKIALDENLDRIRKLLHKK